MSKITDLAVFEVMKDGLLLTEHAPDITLKQIRQQTEASFTAL